MLKRITCAVLWFLTIAWAWNYIVLLSGVPSPIGLALGAAVGALVLVDPLHRLWLTGQAAPASQAAVPAAKPGVLEVVSDAVPSL